MQIRVQTNIPDVIAAMDRASSQVPYATSVALNKVAYTARTAVQADMRRIFDKPTPWVINSLRVKTATKTHLQAELAFKDTPFSERSMVAPHIWGGGRVQKAMEKRLERIGVLPAGWRIVPGRAARLDAYGNISRGQISLILNILGSYTEAGYNKADARTVARLAKGNAKKGVYGLTYWVNPATGPGRAKHLPPGVWQRIKTGFGSAIKPVLIFVPAARYRRVLEWDQTIQRTVDARFSTEFKAAFDAAMASARYTRQGYLL